MADIRELVDIDKGRITGLLFTDEGIYQQELKNVWARTWVFLAHDSMLPKAGSYMQTYIAEDPVVVVRQKDGSVKAFLNQCRHRGMEEWGADCSGFERREWQSAGDRKRGQDGEVVGSGHRQGDPIAERAGR